MRTAMSTSIAISAYFKDMVNDAKILHGACGARRG